MDPICHTLVGLALAETGLKRRAPGGTATLIVGANLPDVDIVSYASGSLAALSFRRGWTHGLLALVVLPLLLAVALFWLHRLRGRWRGAPPEPALLRRVALLAYVSVLTHPVLDMLNTYGMRWLMPFDGRWFYADTLFIVDPWMWVFLAGGAFLARTRRSTRPARVAVGLVVTYVVVMWVGTAVARRDVRNAVHAAARQPVAIVVSPMPVVPWERLVIVDDGTQYRFGRHRWFRAPRFAFEDYAVQKNDRDPAARAAGETTDGAAFLRWARLPFFLVEQRPAGTVVHIVDARYTVDPGAGFGAYTVDLAANRAENDGRAAPSSGTARP